MIIKNIIPAIVSALLVTFIPSTVISQSVEVRSTGPFNKLHVDDGIVVRLIPGDQEKATLKMSGVGPDALRTETVNGTLKIYVYGQPFTQKEVTVDLEFRDLKSIEAINGSEIMTTSLYKPDSLEIVLKTGSAAYLDLDVKYLKSNVIEGSLLTAEGYATKQDIYVASMATVSAFDLESEIINVKSVTGATAKIAVEAELNAEALTRGFISVKGTPSKNNSVARSGGTITGYEE